MMFPDWRSGQTGVNLAHVCHRLVAVAKALQIADVCREIGFDAAAKNVRLAEPFSLAAAAYLVHELDISGELGEFLAACERHHIPLGDAAQVPVKWRPATLPADIVEMLDRELGIDHEPYTLEGAWKQGIFEPEDTGCLCWPIPDVLIANSTIPPRNRLRLDAVRALLGDRAFVYIGEKVGGGPLGRISCYVALPGHDQLDALRVEGTRSEDDEETEDVIIELQDVSRRFPLDILAASDRELTLRVRLSDQTAIDAFTAWYKRYAPRAFGESGYTLEDSSGDWFTMRIWWDLG